MFIKHIVSATDLIFKKELVCDITKTNKQKPPTKTKNRALNVSPFHACTACRFFKPQVCRVSSVKNIQCCQWIKCEHSPQCVQTAWCQCLSRVWSISCAGASRRFQVWVLNSGLWVGSEAGTYHVTSCTVGPVFTGPPTGLNATPALCRAPLPRSPACPEDVRWAEQMFIAVSVRRKPRGKGDSLVPLGATRHVASHPCA